VSDGDRRDDVGRSTPGSRKPSVGENLGLAS
jgi:hypothetical protein